MKHWYLLIWENYSLKPVWPLLTQPNSAILLRSFYKPMKPITTVVSTVVSLLVPATALACSCMGYENPEEGYAVHFANAEMVFMGSVAEVAVAESQSGRTSAVFSVEKAWKGRPEAFTQISTYANSAMCGLEFQKSGTYVIFASRDDAGTMTSSLCNGTVGTDGADALIAWLNDYNGATSSSSASTSLGAPVCAPYVCANGDVHPACTEDGHPINYFVAPCEFSGGEMSQNTSTSTSTGTSGKVFSDVSQNHPNASAITFVKEQGIVKGYADGSFKPDARINRAEFTKIIVGATFGPEYIESCKLTSLFSDVSAGDWFAPFVCLAKKENIIGGYPDGTFKPAQNVNFAEASKIVVNAFALSTNPEDAEGVWWRPYVLALSKIGGLPTTFSDPNQLVTRGEMAEIIMRVMLGLEG